MENPTGCKTKYGAQGVIRAAPPRKGRVVPPKYEASQEVRKRRDTGSG